MNRRPALFTSLSLMIIGVVLGCTYSVLQTGQGLFSPQNMALVTILGAGGILFAGAALGTFKPRPWGYLCLLIVVLFITAADLYCFFRAGTLTLFYLPDMILVISGIYLLSRKSSRRVFFDASIRWWERARRYALGISVYVDSGSTRNEIKIMDISESGCLITTDVTYRLGDKIELGVDNFFVPSVIVRQKSKSEYGLRFELNWKQRRQLRKFLKSTASSIRTSLPSTELKKSA